MGYLRVKDKETGHHLSITQEHYDRDPDVWDVVKSDATYPNGDPLPPKYRTTVDQKATDNTAAKTAETKEK